MAENVINELMYELLESIQSDIHRVEDKVNAQGMRIGSLEVHVAEHSSQFAQVNIRLDKIDDRMTRIERNLDLVRG